MKKKLSSKHKKKYQDEEEDEEEYDEEMNEYQEDDFLVRDEDVEDEEGYNHQLNINPDAPEAVIESELGSSDLDVMEEPKEKRLKKKKSKLDDDMEIIEERSKRKKYNEEEEDMGNFIVKKNEVKNYERFEARRPIKKSIAHDIFSLDLIEKVEEVKISQQMSKIYSKEEIEEQFATEKDLKIKSADLPERILRNFTDDQLSYLQRENEAEAEWILEKLKTSYENFNNVKKKIITVLDYYKKDFLDIPLIVFYRRMNYEPELSQTEIWKIFELDREWNKLSDYKKFVKKTFKQFTKSIEDLRINFIHTDKIKYLLTEENIDIIERKNIDSAKSIRELKDVEFMIAFFKEVYSISHNELYDTLLHRPNKRSFIRDIIESDLHIFVKYFSLTPFELAYNLESLSTGDYNSKSKLIIPPDPKEDPMSVAGRYLNKMFDQEIKVMTSVCRFLALEYSSHPYIKSFSRNYFKNTCFLSTEPTEEGNKELDVFNPSFRVKRINKKPIESFDNDLFIDIIENEKKGFINLKIECNEDLKDISEKINSALNIDHNADRSSFNFKWKIMREEAVRILIVEYLFPDFKKEIRSELLERAENYVISEASQKFQNLLFTGPYKKKNPYSEDDFLKEDDYPIVMSFVYDNLKNEAYCVILDQNGEVVDHTIFRYLCSKPARLIKLEEKQYYHSDQNDCKNLIQKYKPDLIVIGASDLKCRYLREQVMAVDPESMKNNEGKLWITYADLTIPRIFANSPIADKKLSEYKDIFIRTAISQGRFKQNPLAEILNLWNEDINKNYCLSIPLHPYTKLISQTRLMEFLEIEAIKAVNSIGVDINRVVELPHNRSLLNFVSGLGPRKASSMIDSIQVYGGLSMRAQLLINNIVGKKIFLNCSAFLKVKTKPELQEVRNYLDLTRIHPDLYPMANKLALSAVDDEMGKNDDPIEMVMRDPKKLQILDLKDFVRKSEEKGLTVNVNLIINFILTELTHPFKDPRSDHTDLTSKELFNLLLGDTSFDTGYLILAKVVGYDKEQHIKCRLQNDLEATVWIKDIFEDDRIDEYKVKEMKEKYKEGTWFEARVKNINFNNFKIDLTTKPSELSKHTKYYNVRGLDKWFQVTEEDMINKNYQAETKTEVKKYQPRNIKHPNFKNITYEACIELLRNKEIGAFVFRPSSLGTNNLTLSWKMNNHCYSHINIIEEEKIGGVTIGSKLRISNEVYSSLNEIIERYIKPCERIVRETIANRKYMAFNLSEEFEKHLKDEKNKDANIVHYNFTILREFPQFIILGYAPKINQVIKEYIKVKPMGLFFHDEYFSNADELIQWFKKNYNTDSYREYVKKIKPPNVEVKKEEYTIDYQDYNIDNDNRSVASAKMNKPRENYKKNCYTCNQEGHYSADCPNKSMRNNRDGEKKFIKNKRTRSPDNDYSFKQENSWGDHNNDKGWGSESKNNINISDKKDTNRRNSENNFGNNSNQRNWGDDNNSWGGVKTETNLGWGNTNNKELNSNWGNNVKSESNLSWDNNTKNENSNKNFGGFSSTTGNDSNNISKNEITSNWGNKNEVTSSWGNKNDGNSSWGSTIKAEGTSGWGNTAKNDSNLNIGITQSNNSWGNSVKESEQNTSWGNNSFGFNSNIQNNNSSYAASSNEKFNRNQDYSSNRNEENRDRGYRSRNNDGNDRNYRKPRDDDKGFKKNSCYNCNEEGHISKDCPKKSETANKPKGCYNCREPGHFGKNCPNPKKIVCYNCNEEGHFSNNCSKPRDNNRGRGGNRGGGRGRGGFRSPDTYRSPSGDNYNSNENSSPKWNSGNQESNWSSNNYSGGWGKINESESNKSNSVNTTTWGNSNNITNEGNTSSGWGTGNTSSKPWGNNNISSGWGNDDKKNNIENIENNSSLNKSENSYLQKESQSGGWGNSSQAGGNSFAGWGNSSQTGGNSTAGWGNTSSTSGGWGKSETNNQQNKSLGLGQSDQKTDLVNESLNIAPSEKNNSWGSPVKNETNQSSSNKYINESSNNTNKDTSSGWGNNTNNDTSSGWGTNSNKNISSGWGNSSNKDSSELDNNLNKDNSSVSDNKTNKNNISGWGNSTNASSGWGNNTNKDDSSGWGNNTNKDNSSSWGK